MLRNVPSHSSRNPFDGLFPAGVTSAADASLSPPLELLQEERPLIAHAVSKRQSEFARGRACARAALAEIGIHGFPILSGANREPLWPAGVVGSISHTDGLCAAAVAPASRFRGIGIDIEPDRPLSEEIAESVCSRDELRDLERILGFDRLLSARLVFCAKESVYKCQYPVTRTFLEFEDVRIRLEKEGTFEVQGCRIRFKDDWPSRLRGRWKRESGFLVVAAWLQAGSL